MANPKRQSCLPLSQTEDGSLATAPLSTVINAATNEAYQDFYNLIHSEIPIVSANGDSLQPTNAASAKSPGKEDTPAPSNNNTASNEVKKKRMSALSFAQRRHELTRRLFLHTKSISHIYALASSSLPNSHAALHHKTKPYPRLGATVSTASDALKYVREAWVSADEAQDALYYHHDGLWRSRSHAHDVYGALCVLCGGYWPDFPSDVALAVDRYEHSKEKRYGAEELRRRLACGVRRKLVCGEVGEFGCCASSLSAMDDLNNLNQRDSMALPWKVTMESDGGAIRLTYGNPRIISTAEKLRQQSMMSEKNDDSDNSNNSTFDNLQQYPMEARLSILSESTNAPWKLLSLRVQCSPKTGESDHQLHMNKKQMFDLHRIGERVMIVEEAICKKGEKSDETQSDQDTNMVEVEKNSIVPRPLLRLFEVTHTFALSMQIQMLSSQAEALRKGAWGGFVGIPNAASAGITTTISNPGDGIAVSPAHFFDDEKRNKNDSTLPVAVMAVHFWSCDDRYGSPKVGDVNPSKHRVGRMEGIVPTEKMETASSTASISHSKLDNRSDDNFLPVSDHRGEKRLSLCIRAVPMVGLVVSLSGGSDYDASSHNEKGNSSTEDQHTMRNIEKLLSPIHDPFQLSMSDALLAATVLCAQRRCISVVDALNDQKTNKLPSWIHLEVECGSITVAARISYSSDTDSISQSTRPFVILFRLACDSRTGRYIPVFSRSASLLRQLACHDPLASDVEALRSAAAANHSSRIGGTSGRQNDGISREATGRIVRDAFETLTRSMDTLGRKCGVGGEWNDNDKQCASLREKSIDQSCRDVLVSLMTCCGMSAVFGVGAIALKVACGIDPAADIAGGPIKDDHSPETLHVPPLGIMLHQRMTEKSVKEGDGDTRRVPQLKGEIFAVTAKVDDESLCLICYDVLTILESASSVPQRLKLARILTKHLVEPNTCNTEPPLKKARTTSNNGATYHHILDEMKHAAGWFDSMIRQ